jgi:hypothetical protein
MNLLYAVYRWESNLAISYSPVKIIMYSFIRRTAIACKIKEISSSALGLSVMTPRECRVDCLFPGHVIRYCVRTIPPSRSRLFNNLLLGLTLRYLNAVT